LAEVVASATLPGALKPAKLLAKSKDGDIYEYESLGDCWADGSLHADIPKQDISKMFNVKYFIVSQTNPHVIPFIFQNNGSAGEPPLPQYSGGLRGGLLFNFLEMLLKMDMKKWLRLLHAIDLTPSIGGIDLRKIYLQQFLGTVTVCPKIDWTLLWGYIMLFADPSRKDMETYFSYGERLTYPKLNMILHHTRIQKTAEALLERNERTIDN
jgi:TAG lipase/steryl ester hydrolase/phospholipase A2/LPA acyltransferase